MLCLVAILGGVSSANASGLDFGGWYLMPGVPIGATWVEGNPAALHSGVELSLVEFEDRYGTWKGGYVDLLHNAGHTRMSVGPELGWAFVGIDGGLLIRDDGNTGLTVRPMLTMAVISVYYRFGAYLGEASHFHEAALMFKLPIGVWP